MNAVATDSLTRFDFSSIGRMDLETRLRIALVDLDAMRRERDRYRDNLTATQERCSELLEEARAAERRERGVRALLEAVIGCGGSLQNLVFAIEIARVKHPEGANIADLIEEVGEAARAARCETPERFRAELLDSAVICLRMYEGEVRP